jgi:competence protein ComFB
MNNLKDYLYETTGLENLAEKLVFQELYDFTQNAKTMPDNDLCFCCICLADIASIVLNELPPFYCSNFIDKDNNVNYYAKYKSEVQEKIIKAFEKVKKAPHHAK